MKRSLVLILFFLFSSHHSFSQEMMGSANSNFAGQMGMDLNPASMVAAPYTWELHLFSADVSFSNNYMYLVKNSRLIRNSASGEEVPQERFTDHPAQTDKYAYASAFVKYPGFIWSGKKIAFAFHASTRLELSANNVPYDLAKFFKEGFDYAPQHNINYRHDKVDLALMNWHEMAFSAGTVLVNTPGNFITGAATLKYNYGLNAYFLKLSNIDYTVSSDSNLIINNIDAEYGHATPVNGDGGLSDVLNKRGQGGSVDLGIEYYRNRNDEYYNPCNTDHGLKPYDYKIGVSLIDLGYIKYNHEAKTYEYDNLNTNWAGFDTADFSGIGTIDTTFGDQFFGHPNGARDKFSFTMFTPAALSVQLDIPFTSHFFVNISGVQRVAFSRYEIKRSNEISITPRYESRNFEFSIPFSYYDLFRPRLGVAMRIKYFTIGSDMLGPLAGITDAYGADIYVGISIKHFTTCGGSKRSKLKKAKIEMCNTPGE